MNKKMKTTTMLPLRPMPPTRLQRLQALYLRLPTMLCQGKCQDSCGPIALYPIEVDLLRARGLPLPVIAPDDATFTCSALSVDGLCAIYDARPMICRLWGAVAKMQCHHGCQPSRWVSREEQLALMEEIGALSGIMPEQCEKMYWSAGRPPTELIDALAQQRQAAALGVGAGLPTGTLR